MILHSNRSVFAESAHFPSLGFEFVAMLCTAAFASLRLMFVTIMSAAKTIVEDYLRTLRSFYPTDKPPAAPHAHPGPHTARQMAR